MTYQVLVVLLYVNSVFILVTRRVHGHGDLLLTLCLSLYLHLGAADSTDQALCQVPYGAPLPKRNPLA